MKESKQNSSRSIQRLFYNWHAWLGSDLPLVMFVILATGTLATVANEIDWLTFKEMRSTHQLKPPNSEVSAKDWYKTST